MTTKLKEMQQVLIFLDCWARFDYDNNNNYYYYNINNIIITIRIKNKPVGKLSVLGEGD